MCTDTDISTINAYDNKYNWYALVVAILRPDINGYDAAATALGEPGTRGHGQHKRDWSGQRHTKKAEYDARAAKIYADFIDGKTVTDLTITYNLSQNQVFASIRDYCDKIGIPRPARQKYSRHNWTEDEYLEDCDRWN